MSVSLCFFLVVLSSSFEPKDKFQSIKRQIQGQKEAARLGCDYASLSFFYPPLFFNSNHPSLSRLKCLCVGGKADHAIHKQIKVGEAVIACMCNLSFLLRFFFSHLPAPSNLNESLSSGKGKPYNPQQVQGRIREILGKYSNGFWVSKLPQIYRELYKQDLPTEAIKDLETWTHICTVCTPYVPVVICYILLL